MYMPIGVEIKQDAAGLEDTQPFRVRPARMFQIPPVPDDPQEPVDEIPQEIRDQVIDFDFPDVVIARAAWLYAQTDPMMQPRVQTLEEQYKGMMYQLIERDTAFTDAPDQNEIIVPVQNDIYGESTWRPWPVANRR